MSTRKLKQHPQTLNLLQVQYGDTSVLNYFAFLAGYGPLKEQFPVRENPSVIYVRVHSQ